MEYTVVREYDLDDFIKAVNSNLEDGWKTIGGVAVSPPPDGSGLLFFYQAMEKRAESEFRFGGSDETQ